MSSAVNLSASVRANLTALQSTANLMTTTQAHLSTGKKVASALDNPVNFFTAAGLDSRSSQLSGLMDGMSNGVQAIQSANQGITSATSIIKQLQSTVKQAQQDSATVTAGIANVLSTKNSSDDAADKISFTLSNGATVGISTYGKASTATAASVTADQGFTAISSSGTSTVGSFTIASASLTGGDATISLDPTNAGNAADAAASINKQLSKVAGGTNIQASVDSSGKLKLIDKTGSDITITDGAAKTAETIGFKTNLTSTDDTKGGTPGVKVGADAALSVDDLITSINNNSLLQGQVKATKDSNGYLNLQNLTGAKIDVTGASSTGVTGKVADTSTLGAGTGGISDTRRTLANQFNSLLTQLDGIAKDSGYNGVNLLAGDKLNIQFNEKTGKDTNLLSVQLQNPDGSAFGTLGSDSLGLSLAATTADGSSGDFSINSNLDAFSNSLTKALSTLQNQSSQLGSSLAVTQTRQDFTKEIINVLNTGSSNLTDADMNEEAANSQALSTRQSLGISALSLANTAAQGVLQLLR
jgi:hypothetical protein